MSRNPLGRSVLNLPAFSLLTLLVSSSAVAQQYYGGVTGTVTDPSGAVSPTLP